MVRLRFSVELNYDVAPPGCDFIFNIHAAHTARQRVLSERLVLNQGVPHTVDTEPASGNRYLRLSARPGPLRLAYDATVELVHHKAWPADRKSVV